MGVLEISSHQIKETESNRRNDNRRSFYWNEIGQIQGFFAEKKLSFSLVDLSASGAQLSIRDDIGFLSEGDSIELKIPGVNSTKIIGEIKRIALINEKTDPEYKVGIEFITKVSKVPEAFTLNPYYQAIFHAKEPLSFGGHFASKVIAYTPEGFIFETNSEDPFAIPGVVLQGKIQIPFAGEYKVKIEIAGSTNEENTRVYGLLIDPPKRLLAAFSSNLLASGHYSISELRDSKFLVGSVRKVIKYTYRKDEEDFKKILRLRLAGAKSAGRWLDTNDESVMEDKYDSYSRHVMAYCGSELVSAGRIVFNNGNKLRSEHVGYGIELPKYLWEEGFLEISRLVVEKDFRGADIFLGTLAEFAIIAIQNDLKYLVLNCVDELVPVYEKFGAKKLSVKFYTEFMQDRALNLLVLNVNDSMTGKMNFVAWSEISNIHSYISSHKSQLALSLFQRFRIRIFKKLSLFGRYFFNKVMLKKAVKASNIEKKVTR